MIEPTAFPGIGWSRPSGARAGSPHHFAEAQYNKSDHFTVLDGLRIRFGGDGGYADAPQPQKSLIARPR
jgi:hypothetical protein